VLTSHGTSHNEYKYATTLERLRFIHWSKEAEERMVENISEIGKIIAVSSFVKNELKQIYNIPDEKIEVVYNGVDTDLYKPLTNNPSGDYFLYVGRLEKRKGFYELLDAIKELQNYKFVIISSSFRQRRLNEYAKTLLSLSKKQKNVIIKQNVGDNEIKEYYTNAKATILPSRYDPFPYTVLESMACGTPCIVSDNGGAKEAIGKYGKVFRAGSSESLKSAIESFSYPQSWRKKVRERVERMFNVDVFIQNILTLYHEVIEEQR
jgi:glycosyltransferase involved in cell wall biosynthesis